MACEALSILLKQVHGNGQHPPEDVCEAVAQLHQMGKLLPFFLMVPAKYEHNPAFDWAGCAEACRK